MANISQGRSSAIAKNTMYMFVRMVLVAAISFYTSRVVLNILGVVDFGIYNIVGSIVIFLSFFQNALTNATYRHLAYEIGTGDSEKLRKIFSMSMSLYLILAVLLLIVLEAIGPWVIAHKLNIPASRIGAAVSVFHFSLLVFCVEIIKTPYNSSIVVHEKMNFYAITSIIEVLLKLGIVLLLVWLPFDKLILYGILQVVVSVIMLIWYRYYCRSHFEETIYYPYWNKNILKRLASYSGWSMVVNAADVTVVQCMNVFLNIFGGVVSNAAMGVANQVNALLNKFLNTFTTSFTPQLIKSYAQGDVSYFMRLIFSTSKISFYLFFMLAFPIALNIDYLLDIWLIDPPAQSGLFVCLIILYSLFDSFSVSLWNAVHATGNIKTHQLLMASIKILNIPISFILLKNGMPVWSAIAVYAILNAVCSIVRIVYLKKLINLSLRQYFKNVLLKMFIVVVAACLLPIISVFCNLSSFEHLLVSTVLFIIGYPLIIYIYGLNHEERLLVQGIFALLKKRIK